MDCFSVILLLFICWVNDVSETRKRVPADWKPAGAFLFELIFALYIYG